MERHDISDEALLRNCEVLARLKKGDRVEADCWHAFHDVRLTGRVTELSMSAKYLCLGQERISFEDLYAIRLIPDTEKKMIL